MGLDALLPSSTGDDTIAGQTFNEVNWRRGVWAGLDGPLVAWLAEYVIRFVARNGPNFFDWNSGVYVVRPPADDEQ